jgi:hypothetical protein
MKYVGLALLYSMFDKSPKLIWLWRQYNWKCFRFSLLDVEHVVTCILQSIGTWISLIVLVPFPGLSSRVYELYLSIHSVKTIASLHNIKCMNAFKEISFLRCIWS